MLINKFYVKKRNILISFFILICSNIFSQTNTLKVCVGLTESEVVSYLDSLNVPIEKISKTTTSDGDLQLNLYFGIDNQKKYNCLFSVFLFQRKKGVEICSNQILSGYREFALPYLNLVKDSFDKVSTNNWEFNDVIKKLKITAKYSTTEGDISYYNLIYSMN
jgi:hypothetical protein